jgi:lysophospholipase L1-like esterase
VVAFLPPRFMLSDTARDNLKFVPKQRLRDDAEARIAALTQALNRPFVPLSNGLIQGNTQPLYIPADYTHLNAAGHSIAADTIAQALNPILAGDASCDAR